MPFCSCCKKKAVPDDDFETYVRIIASLMTTLRRPEDKRYLQEILLHCTELNSSKKPEVKRYNNAFLAYFIKVLHTTASTQPLEIYEEWYSNSNSNTQNKSSAATRVWLEENKSFFAMEKTSDGALIFYSAVAINPKAGWDIGGIGKVLKQQEEQFLKSQIEK